MKILLRKCSLIRCRDFTFFNRFQVVGNCRSRKWKNLSRYETDDRSMKNCENQVIVGECIWKFVSSYCSKKDFERRAKMIRSRTTMVSQKLRFFQFLLDQISEIFQLKMVPRLLVLLLRFPILLSCRACIRNKYFFTYFPLQKTVCN